MMTGKKELTTLIGAIMKYIEKLYPEDTYLQERALETLILALRVQLQGGYISRNLSSNSLIIYGKDGSILRHLFFQTLERIEGFQYLVSELMWAIQYSKLDKRT